MYHISWVDHLKQLHANINSDAMQNFIHVLFCLKLIFPSFHPEHLTKTGIVLFHSRLWDLLILLILPSITAFNNLVFRVQMVPRETRASKVPRGFLARSGSQVGLVVQESRDARGTLDHRVTTVPM